jgi:hypothetical protein
MRSLGNSSYSRFDGALVAVALGFLAAILFSFSLTGTAMAAEEGAGWELSANTYPTNLIPSKAPGEASGTIAVEVFNIGAANSSGTVTVTDRLPEGVHAKEAGRLFSIGREENVGFGVEARVTPGVWDCTGNGPGVAPAVAGASVVTCTSDPAGLPSIAGGGGNPTFENHGDVEPAIGILVEAGGEASGLTNHVSISGGGAREPAATEDPVTVSRTPARGGLTQTDMWLSNANGTVDTQAGSHPYSATFVFDLATAIEQNNYNTIYIPGSELRNLETVTPPGLVGNLNGAPQCNRVQFFANHCPVGSNVGSLHISVTKEAEVREAVYNMAPHPGVPAEIAFNYEGEHFYVAFAVRSGGSYAIVGHANSLPSEGVYQSILTLWGVPEEASHDPWRGEYYRNRGGVLEGSPKPFLTLPTSCGTPELFTARETSGWQEPNARTEASVLTHDASDTPAGFTGCEGLAFEPAISIQTDTARADTPTGLTAEVTPTLGGLEAPERRSAADIKDTTVVLPPGLVINPGQAAGLQACPPGPPSHEPGAEHYGDNLPLAGESGEQESFDAPADCPNASKVGTFTIKTPLIEADEEKQFEGDVYLLQSNPPELKLLLAGSADGVNLKIVGKTSLCEAAGEVLDGKTCEAPGQLIAAFDETPQLPFTLFKLSFSGGAQAALDTPPQCGSYTANADFTPWSSPFVSNFLQSSVFALSEGPGGGGCPANPLPFNPTLTAGATTDQAGGFTDFSMLLQRGDGQQRIEKLQFKAPEGLSGMISQVPLCDEADANAGTCPASSHIGHAVVTSGPGPYPLVIPQPGEPEAAIYLTGPYGGAPFGLSIVTPVIAGPFNLGTIVTRASIAVDPSTAQITVTTNPLPQIVDGVPTDLREVDAVIDRPGFIFNPTNCDPQSFSGTATSTQGVQAGISSPFGVGSCQSLKFEPKFSVTTSGKTSKALGASLTAKLTYPNVPQGTDADIAKVKVELPKQLPSRLTTLQKACTAAQFEANPAGCPSASFIGYATVNTPLLPVPLKGPAIFVSHGGESFPSLTLVLQGEGVTIELVGATFISKTGVTSTTFKTVPDAPFSTFELTLPEGPYSALAANGNLCTSKLTLPNEFVGQDGAVIHENTPISVAGCAKAKTKALTRAQKLTKALKACHKDKNKGKRAKCEKQARVKYGAKKSNRRAK